MGTGGVRTTEDGLAMAGPMAANGIGVNPLTLAVSSAGLRLRSQLAASSNSGAWLELLFAMAAYTAKTPVPEVSDSIVQFVFDQPALFEKTHPCGLRQSPSSMAANELGMAAQVGNVVDHGGDWY